MMSTGSVFGKVEYDYWWVHSLRRSTYTAYNRNHGAQGIGYDVE
ncbi:MAG: hypothetical protein ACLT1C_02960 [Weissella confusa]